MPTPRPTDPEARKLDRELSRRMWGGVALRLALGLIGALLILGITAAVKAIADPFPPRLLYAYELANEHWGGPPTGCSSVSLEVVADGSLSEGGVEVEARATLPTPGAPPEPCIMQIIARDAAPNWFPRACAVIRHEAGHLHGLAHTDTPGSIMNLEVTFVPNQCARAGLFLLNHPFYPQRRFRP